MTKAFSYDLPDFWAPSLIYGDNSCLSDEDVAALNAWIDSVDHDLTCVDVTDELGFLKYHDAKQFGVLAADCFTYEFTVS